MDIERIRDKRNSKVVAFSRYCQEKIKFKDYLFCFFEGEDAKYYIPRIQKYSSYTFDKIIHYNCGGKNGVLYNLEMTKNDDECYHRAFFVDKDYDGVIQDSRYLYETPCYSVENFYTSELAFKKMLNIEFGINITDEDMIKVSDDYSERLEEFHGHTLLLNSWLACQRFCEKEINKKDSITLKDFKITKLFSEITIEKVVCKQEITVNQLKELFPNSIDVSESMLCEKIEFFQKSSCRELFRGKFEADFLKKIINSLIIRNKEGTYFSKKYTSVNINPDANFLSTLSDYADTPDCLVDFIGQYNIV